MIYEFLGKSLAYWAGLQKVMEDLGLEAPDELRERLKPTRVGGGDLDRLMIEALPQGGYLVTAAGQTYAMTHNQLSAHTTLGDALAFVGRSMK